MKNIIVYIFLSYVAFASDFGLEIGLIGQFPQNEFKDEEVPVFPIKAQNLMEKYHISEGKLLGIKLKKIEEKWINNDFKVSDKEVVQVLEN